MPVGYNPIMKSERVLNLVLRIFGMALVIGAGGLVLGAGAGFLLSALMRNQSGGWGDLVGAIISLLIFVPTGVVLGLIIYKIRHYRGSLLLGIAGVVLGELLTFSFYHLLLARVSSAVLILCFLVPAPLLGAVGYHLGRKKRSGETPL